MGTELCHAGFVLADFGMTEIIPTFSFLGISLGCCVSIGSFEEDDDPRDIECGSMFTEKFAKLLQQGTLVVFNLTLIYALL